MKILIAEDDAVSRRLLRGHLERWGHTVTEAVDGAEAWELMLAGERGDLEEGGGYSLVIADWMMPAMDGLELIQRIRHAQLPRYVYILMLTAKNEKSDIVHGMDAGADDYLTKPFDKDELRSRLQAGIRILKLQAALTQSEKSAAVGRLAVGVAAEVAVPLNEVADSMRELRQDLHHVAEALSPVGHEVASVAVDPDGPPRVETSAPDLEQIRSTMGPKFLAAEGKIHKVRELMRSLRDFARLDELPTKALAVGPLVTDTLAMMRSEFAARSLRVDWAEPSDSLMVQGNAGKLKRAIYNLLSVLAETEAVGGTITILARPEEAGPHGDAVDIDLCSSSSGLPLEVLPQLFEPFAVGDTQWGLGLPIAFSILREHGGTLEAGPYMGGTRFRVRLPKGS